MCGEAAVVTSPKTCVPKLLQYGGYQVPESIEEDDMMKVMETIDMSLRGSVVRGCRLKGRLLCI